MKGVIGFFDILGYQNFLENNSEIVYAERIVELILGTPEDVIKAVQDYNFNPIINEITKDIKHIVFSDTIVIVIEYGNEPEELKRSLAYQTMILTASELTAKMFLLGLPTRGVLHEGEFLIKGFCLAGKAVVESYKLCEKLNYSGLVCTKVLQEKLEPILTTPMYDSFLFKYLTPLKNGEEQLLNCNWINFFIDPIENIDDFVFTAFSAHNKDCSISVDTKILNTSKSIRKMQHLKKLRVQHLEK